MTKKPTGRLDLPVRAGLRGGADKLRSTLLGPEMSQVSSLRLIRMEGRLAASVRGGEVEQEMVGRTLRIVGNSDASQQGFPQGPRPV